MIKRFALIVMGLGCLTGVGHSTYTKQFTIVNKTGTPISLRGVVAQTLCFEGNCQELEPATEWISGKARNNQGVLVTLPSASIPSLVDSITIVLPDGDVRQDASTGWPTPYPNTYIVNHFGDSKSLSYAIQTNYPTGATRIEYPPCPEYIIEGEPAPACNPITVPVYASATLTAPENGKIYTITIDSRSKQAIITS